MKVRQLLFFVLLTLVSTGSGVVMADPSCGPWEDQGNGTSERVCVGDDGKTYCEQSANGTISRIAC